MIIALLSLAGCQPPPPGERFSTHALANGATETAHVHTQPDGDLEIVVGFENTPERYSSEDVDYANNLLLGEVAPARAACAPRDARRLDSRYVPERIVRISHWHCV